MTAIRGMARGVANDNAAPKRVRRRSLKTITLRTGTICAAMPPSENGAKADWEDTAFFSTALDLHMRRYGETSDDLCRAIAKSGDAIDPHLIDLWRTGRKVPRGPSAKRALERIEHRYRLPTGYFIEKVDRRLRAPRNSI